MHLDADDTTLARVLEHANLPALVPALVQLTGDASLLERFRPPTPGMMGMVEGGYSDEEQAAIRALAFDVLRTWRDGDGTRPPLPSTELLHRMMTWCAGEPIPAEYVPLALEEAALEDRDPRRFEWNDRPDEATLRDFHVAIIGAGFGGLCTAIRLEQAGIPYTVFEKNDAVGGTWYENAYPDLRVDVPNHFYSFSFEPNPDWTDFFSRRDELEAYAQSVAVEYGVVQNVRFETEVVGAEYDDASACWQVRVRGPAGREETVRANALVSAVGMLNRPQTPDIEGLDRFAGTCFHSSRWPQDLDLAGRRVGVIGTGASAMQFVPPIAPEVERLTIFQRAAHWATYNPAYHAKVSDDFRWLLHHVPYYHSWYRFLVFWTGADRVYPVFRIDPDWKESDRSVSAANEMMRQASIAHLEAELGGDAELVAKCTPDYPPLGKRPLLDNGWYRTLVRDDVDLVTDGIRAVVPEGVVAGDGALYELDVLILATGFHAGKFLWPMEITGRGGVRLQERWVMGEDPRAYLGITVPDFPNLFCLYGPNTNPVVGSVIFMLECQTTYVMDCLRRMIEGGHRAIDCRPDVHDAYNERLDAELEHMVWSHPRVKSYYNNAAGRVITNVPWTMYDYWNMTRRVDLDDYRVD